MEIDKKTLKALSSDTKVEILKNLNNRRKMPTELSRELNLAPSTTSEHLKEMEKLGLVKRIETGHKWIYYELTQNGKNIMRPSFPIQIIFTVFIGFVMVIGSFFASTQQPLAMKSVPEAAATATDSGRDFSSASSNDIIMIIVFIAGILLIAYGIWKMRKR
ncbi:MAG: ArsR family transcriptional regulator [Candidatus Aenigmatarchaeota archaeon]